MQRTAGSLDMVFQFLGSFTGAVTVAHRHRPDTPGNPSHHGIFRAHAVAEKERQVGRKFIDVHAPGEVGFHKGEAVCQGKCKL